MKIASRVLFAEVVVSVVTLFCLLCLTSSSSNDNNNLFVMAQFGGRGGGGPQGQRPDGAGGRTGMPMQGQMDDKFDAQMPDMNQGDAGPSEDENYFKFMPGRDKKRPDEGMAGDPRSRPGQRATGRKMPDRRMGGGNFESRGYSSQSAGGRPPPGGMNDGLGGDGPIPENDFDREEYNKHKDTQGMNDFAKTKRPGVKVDTSFRDRIKGFQNNPFMQQSRSRHAEEAYPNDMTGGGDRRKQPVKKRKASKNKKYEYAPAKPGHVKADRKAKKHHYTKGAGGGSANFDEDDFNNNGGQQNQQGLSLKCFKVAKNICSVRVMHENFAAYTKCIYENRKEFGKKCEDWAGVQGACLKDMQDKCNKKNPAKTTKCLREKADKGGLTNACKDSEFYKSLEQGFNRFSENYNAAGGDDVFEHDASSFNDMFDDDSAKQNMKEQAFKDAKTSFGDFDMEEIKKSARESVFKNKGANPDDHDPPFNSRGPGDHREPHEFPAGGGGGGGGAERIPRERQIGSGSASKMQPIDDL